ncbi:MAG: hypothetical protein AAF726_10745 [Planctomycetota bacterium]
MKLSTRFTASLLSASALGALAGAQETLDFTIDAVASQGLVSGVTPIGPVNGTPPDYGLSGTVGVVLDGVPGSSPSSVSLSGTGGAIVAPDISAEIPNFNPAAPPFAIITITNLAFSFSSPAAAVDPGGSFQTQVTTTVVSGTVTIDASGLTSIIDIAGFSSQPEAFAGSVVVTGTDTRISGQYSGTFQIFDPVAMVAADLNFAGTLAADFAAAAPTVFCSSNANSTGAVGAIGSAGTTSFTAADLVLEASNLPTNAFVLFLASDTTDFVPNFGTSQGNLCLGGTIFRIDNVQNSGQSGAASIPAPFTITPGAAFDIGETWYFQAWYRDSVGGSATSNTTDALEVVFAP